MQSSSAPGRTEQEQEQGEPLTTLEDEQAEFRKDIDESPEEADSIVTGPYVWQRSGEEEGYTLLPTHVTASLDLPTLPRNKMPSFRPGATANPHVGSTNVMNNAHCCCANRETAVEDLNIYTV